ncbi:MAG: phosphoglycerate mutase, partial [Actinomycetota bacterium]
MSLLVELVAAAQAPPRADEAAAGPLDEAGTGRAAALATELAAADPAVSALWSAPSPRCRATLVP